MRQSISRTIGVFFGVIILVNIFIDNPKFVKLSDQADFELRSNHPELAEKTLMNILFHDSLNIENHYRYINAHFDIPKKKKIDRNSYDYRDDDIIFNYYNSMAQSKDSIIADIGYYGKGLILGNLEDYNAAIAVFLQVKNKNLRFLNNSIGYVYNKNNSFKLAEFHFRKEIENNGNLDGAYYNLIKLLFAQERTNELNELLKNPNVKKYFPEKVERAIYFKSFQPINYGKSLFNGIIFSFNIWGSIAAFLIMCCWIMYLRRLDIYEVEKWKHIILVVILGMVFSFLTYPLSDFDNLIFSFKLNGGIINDFFYSVIGIGAIEEFVKIIPLLLMMRFTKAVNEPFDYIKYASLSALGFAFVENLNYFDESSLHMIHGRAMSAVVSHMFNSSIIAYGIILNKYKRHKNTYLNFIFFFILAAISHGFYDFWLINESANTLSILTFFYLLISMSIWNSFISNALNHSDFYDKDKSIDNEKLIDYLIYSLAGILLFEYIALSFKFGPSIAIGLLISSLYAGTYLLIFLTNNLGNFSINNGEWAPLKYWQKREYDESYVENEAQLNPKIYEKAIGIEIKLTQFSNNDFQNEFLPKSGEITKRLTVSKEPGWYEVKLDSIIKSDSYLEDTVLIRAKDRTELIKRRKKIFVALFIIPIETDMNKEVLNRKDFVFCGWAVSE